MRVGGADLNRLPERKLPLLRRKLGVVFQDFKLLPGESVFENVALPLRVRGARGATVRERVGKVLAQVDLADKARLAAETLSGGEQQRVAIARRPGAPPLIWRRAHGNLDPPERPRDKPSLLPPTPPAPVIVSHTTQPLHRCWPGPLLHLRAGAGSQPGNRLDPWAAPGARFGAIPVQGVAVMRLRWAMALVGAYLNLASTWRRPSPAWPPGWPSRR